MTALYRFAMTPPSETGGDPGRYHEKLAKACGKFAEAAEVLRREALTDAEYRQTI